jgi:hypothetical protein
LRWTPCWGLGNVPMEECINKLYETRFWRYGEHRPDEISLHIVSVRMEGKERGLVDGMGLYYTTSLREWYYL